MQSETGGRSTDGRNNSQRPRWRLSRPRRPPPDLTAAESSSRGRSEGSGTGGNGRAKRDEREVDRQEKRQPKAKVAVVAATAAPACPRRRGVELAVGKVTVTIITNTLFVVFQL